MKWFIMIFMLWFVHPVHAFDTVIEKQDGQFKLFLVVEGKELLSSPKEGLWSVATGWKDDWPSTWYHASPVEKVKSGDWTIFSGRLETDQGRFNIRDALIKQDNVIKCVRRFHWTGDDTLKQATLTIRFSTPGTGKGVFMPGILYYGNPSGEKSGFTPVYRGQNGEIALYEEHRFPMPFVSLEWRDKNESLGAALHSLPSTVPYAHLEDQWWSLGALAHENETELCLFSGPCASNGKKSVIKAYQRKNQGFAEHNHAYMNIPPGAVIEKTFYLQIYPVEHKGSGFQQPVHTSIQFFNPFCVQDMPSFPEIIEAKSKFAQTRWHDKGDIAGFKKFPHRDTFVFGWCGQAAAPGYALQIIDPDWPELSTETVVQKSLDFLSDVDFYDKGFYTWYQVNKHAWEERSNPELLSQGQAMNNFANAIRVGSTKGFDIKKWESFLIQASDFHAQRILDSSWSPTSTNEAFFIAPLCKAFQLFQKKQYRQAAIKAGKTYKTRHLDMEEPYWGGTLDASCEDKEGAYAAFQGFLALYESTGEKRYLDWAKHACDVVLSYVVVWDIDMPPGRLRDHSFKTRGWTAVSVQNMHIDVYGVLMVPDIYRLGEITNNDQLKKIAILMYRSCGQLLDPFGSQGEQPHHTNYAQKTQTMGTDYTVYRGNYVEDWTVFWITAHFLNAAAQLQEMGVALD